MFVIPVADCVIQAAEPLVEPPEDARLAATHGTADVERTDALASHVLALGERFLHLIRQVEEPGIRTNPERLLLKLKVFEYIHAELGTTTPSVISSRRRAVKRELQFAEQMQPVQGIP